MNKLFQIFKVDDAEANRIAKEPNEPHNHEFEELMIGIVGELEHFIDFNVITTKAPFVSFVTKGKIHRVVPKAVQGKCEIWILRFKSEFIAETTFQLYALYHNQANIKLESGSCFNRLVTVCELIHQETQLSEPNYSVIRQLLGVLFTMVEDERNKIQEPEHILHKTKHISFKNFLNILEDNYHWALGVEFYADKLFMSVRNLNLICQNILQQSVSEIIETRKLIEAKNLLITTDKTISEIAFELGYNENSYFSNVFKKKAGQSPSEFREEMRVLLMS